LRRIALMALTAVVGSLLVGASATAAPYVVERFLTTAVHGDVAVVKRDGSTASLTFDRGRLTAVSETSLSVQRADGQAVTLTRTAATRVRVNGGLNVNRNVLVVSREGTAIRVDVGSFMAGVRPGVGLVNDGVHADVAVRLRAGTTRTLAVDKGRVTARTSTSLTVLRADGQTVTMALPTNARVTFGWRGLRTINRLRRNVFVTVVSESGKALSISASAAAFRR
jgi:hypothetical protein